MLAMQRPGRRKILILCSLDGFANSVRPMKIRAYLEAKGHDVELFDTREEYSPKLGGRFARKVAPRSIRQYGSYFSLRSKARHLEPIIREKQPDVLICETYSAAYVLTKNLPCVTVYDAPTPYADHLHFSGEISAHLFELHRQMELEIFESVDFLTFHWESFNEYVKKTYTGENMFVLNWGCTEGSTQARFATPPRIVCLGFLEGYWVNLPLLSALSKQYPIDVYGGPPPDEKWGLNYLGYAPSPDLLAEYQFGLITITDDELRRKGFSSKHLEYLSHGLPVLCPEWRQDRRLGDVTIPFNEENFLAQLGKYSEPRAWNEMHTRCVTKAASLSWERQLRPLDKIVDASN